MSDLVKILEQEGMLGIICSSPFVLQMGRQAQEGMCFILLLFFV